MFKKEYVKVINSIYDEIYNILGIDKNIYDIMIYDNNNKIDFIKVGIRDIINDDWDCFFKIFIGDVDGCEGVYGKTKKTSELKNTCDLIKKNMVVISDKLESIDIGDFVKIRDNDNAHLKLDDIAHFKPIVFEYLKDVEVKRLIEICSIYGYDDISIDRQSLIEYFSYQLIFREHCDMNSYSIVLDIDADVLSNFNYENITTQTYKHGEELIYVYDMDKYNVFL